MEGHEPRSQQDIADQLGVSPITLHRWRKSGRGPAYIRLDGSIRYLQRDVDEWLMSRRVDPKAQA